MHQHRLVTDDLGTLLGTFDGIHYLDVEFIFSENSARIIKLRMIFCPPSMDPVAAETMHTMLGKSLKTMHVQVVSFYNTEQENADPDKIFSKPEGSINLSLNELNYLYSTLVDFMIKIAQNESIDILYFSAESEQLNKIYTRYVKKFAEQRNLEYINDGGNYAIQMQRHS
ncbi:hypothetical protein KKJ09_18270 [Xenorhabdus bovienii]|uniref:hypothetical protein n=2 Tax=Xenorhabdus bovienii TaxID=40576 RepID=UPI0023B2DBEA|nr:hypothetical protein [Xenorhabdus bovienii]MDE9495475.1 hypothetical protein [Xenorhabdus bovienii]MDE9503899.1 hypothetical protein [Xenorhabdus bovienii]